MTFKKILVGSLVGMVAINAHAGLISFGAGYLVGSSGKSSKENVEATIITSDKHDVIVCKADNHDTEKCDYQWRDVCVEDRREKGCWKYVATPERYAGLNGYKTIYKISAALSGNTKYIVMEVGDKAKIEEK